VRVLILIVALMLTAGGLLYGDPARIASMQQAVASTATDVSAALRTHGSGKAASSANLTTGSIRATEIERKSGNEFAVKAKINNVHAPMVVDTGATSVTLTWETAKALGLPLDMLTYDVDVETASGRTRAARLTIDKLAVGEVVERSVPALIVPRGQLKNNLLGMSFFDRLESWEVRADKLTIRAYP
jgi:aspartyl protease family protein